MSKVVRILAGAALIVAGAITGNFQLIFVGASLVGGALLEPKVGGGPRAAAAAQLQLGEQPRQAILGRAAVGGSLVDAFNYGGKYQTDWEVLVISLADHRCDALEGFFVDDAYVAFTGDGNVAGFNNQLQVFWRSGAWDQSVPSILTTNGPGWTANDRGRGVSYVVVAYKSDEADAKNPVWPSGRPRFRWVVRGLRCYQARKDSTVGGSGAHRWDNPATWEWTENPIDIRHNWVRGIYAGDRVSEPGMLLIGRGLTAIEAPPANVFPRANLCDELVAGAPRYRIGGVVASTEPYLDVENDFAAAVGGTISQPEGAVEVDPGQAKAPIAHFTDADLLVGSKARWSEFLGQQDEGWVNTVAVRFVDPSQRWNVRSAPVRRELSEVIADGGPRETQPQLDLVTNQPQAQRIAEIIRRFGRLWGRAQVTLPPRFCFIEEGDWVTWQSDRRFGGATRTFRVEAWSSDRAWHHQLVLRQISASVFSDTAPLDDGVIASTRPLPPVVGQPAAGAFALSATDIAAGSVRVPALRVTGQRDDPAAQNIIIEYVRQTAAPGVSTQWIFALNGRGDLVRADIPVPSGGTYWVAISYVVQGVLGDRRVLGPITLVDFAYPDGTSFASLQPIEVGANKTETRIAAGIKDQAPAATDPTIQTGATRGAPPGTLVGGVEASGLVDDAARAKADAAQSLIDLTAIASDSVLTRGEKINVRERRDNISNEFPIWRDRGIALDISPDTRASYQQSYDELIAYLTAINVNASTNTNINRADFVAAFNNYALARERVIDAVAVAASQRASWPAVADVPAALTDIRAADGRLNADRIGWIGLPGQSVNDFKPQEVNANRTENRVAASILSQGPLATSTIPYTTMNGRQRLNSLDVYYDDGIYVSSLRPQEVNSNRTEGRVASSVLNQTSWATLTASTNRLSRINDFGRISDPTIYNAQAILGPRNVSAIVPTYTVNGSNVTINLPAHTRRFAGPSGPLTLSYGAASGVEPFNAYWAAFVDDPNLTGFSSPPVQITNDPATLLFPGRYHIASGVTPGPGGSGGSTGSGGGGGSSGGGGFTAPNVPPGTNYP